MLCIISFIACKILFAEFTQVRGRDVTNNCMNALTCYRACSLSRRRRRRRRRGSFNTIVICSQQNWMRVITEGQVLSL